MLNMLLDDARQLADLQKPTRNKAIVLAAHPHLHRFLWSLCPTVDKIIHTWLYSVNLFTEIKIILIGAHHILPPPTKKLGRLSGRL